MNSDFHDWYNHEGGRKDAPNKIWEQYVHARARKVRKRARFDTPQFLSQMNSEFHETWYDYEGGIKDVPNKIWEKYLHATCVNVHARF